MDSQTHSFLVSDLFAVLEKKLAQPVVVVHLPYLAPDNSFYLCMYPYSVSNPQITADLKQTPYSYTRDNLSLLSALDAIDGTPDFLGEAFVQRFHIRGSDGSDVPHVLISSADITRPDNSGSWFLGKVSLSALAFNNLDPLTSADFEDYRRSLVDHLLSRMT